MDAKALAKSKRAHSQQHSKKPHTSQKPKPTSGGSSGGANSKKPLGKQLREKARQAQLISALPSNLDRYEEQFDWDSEAVSADNAPQVSDAVVPKSKGADYNYLIAEARSHALSNPYSDDFPSLNDVLPGDFNQFVGSMISVRGENILSWIGDDNFVVEDRTNATPEASFLSLNLHALAEQLEKIDICQRLFIEDLFPPETCEGSSKASSNQESEQMQITCGSEVAPQRTEGLLFSEFPESFRIPDKNFECSPPHSDRKHLESTSSNADLDLKDQFKDDFNSLSKCVESREHESAATGNINSVEISGKKISKFEAVTAEAELDMLLDSFNEIKPPGLSGIKYESTSSNFQKESSTPGMAVNFDDELDNLLEETSINEFQGEGSSVSGRLMEKE